MREYSGTVAFIDLLGIGALTRGELKLIDRDFEAFSIISTEKTNHIFGAHLLAFFRRELMRVRDKFPGVQVAQLSDSAMLWSDDSLQLVDAVRALMWWVTLSGLLCRGGLAQGQIVEPNKVATSLGQFVLGDSVTKAVEMEHKGKGCRVFSDLEVQPHLFPKLGDIGNPFLSVKNPLDGSIVDEFRWYLFPKSFDSVVEDSITYRKQLAGSIIELIGRLWFSPQFRWNAASSLGEVQVAMSIETISAALHAITRSPEHRISSETLMEHLHDNRSDDKQVEFYLKQISVANRSIEQVSIKG